MLPMPILSVLDLSPIRNAHELMILRDARHRTIAGAPQQIREQLAEAFDLPRCSTPPAHA
jgi:alkanesulfonate monooxygenase SsuD/methylene tetrahydromethanopterin reductase-like flavin-dependent oxidoreductase (luciferase family)